MPVYPGANKSPLHSSTRHTYESECLRMRLDRITQITTNRPKRNVIHEGGILFKMWRKTGFLIERSIHANASFLQLSGVGLPREQEGMPLSLGSELSNDWEKPEDCVG